MTGKKTRRKKKKSLGVSLLLALAFAVALSSISFLFLSVERITGEAMSPTLQSGDIVVSIAVKEFRTGDLVVFSQGDDTFARRYIGKQADVIDFDDEGTLVLNGEEIEEPYVLNRIANTVDTTFPYQVPAARYFVLADDRETSIDSRLSAIAGISAKQMIGKVYLRIWPFNRIEWLG